MSFTTGAAAHEQDDFFDRSAAIAAVMSVSAAQARDQIQVAGSSTVLPYAKIVAETFGETFPNFKTPVAESGGSGAGIKEFCKGVGENTIDIANASRAMKDSELKSCIDAGVKDVQEVRFAGDGIVFATDAKGPIEAEAGRCLQGSRSQARRRRQAGRQLNTKWNQVNPEPSDWDIAAYIPGEKHGTREEERSSPTAASTPALWTKSRRPVLTTRLPLPSVSQCARTAKLSTSTAIMPKRSPASTPTRPALVYSASTSSKTTLTAGRLRPSTTSPSSAETVASGEYPVSRPLFFYEEGSLGVIPGLKEYVEFFLNDQMIGPDGPLAEYGLVPAPTQNVKHSAPPSPKARRWLRSKF